MVDKATLTYFEKEVAINHEILTSSEYKSDIIS